MLNAGIQDTQKFDYLEHLVKYKLIEFILNKKRAVPTNGSFNNMRTFSSCGRKQQIRMPVTRQGLLENCNLGQFFYYFFFHQ